ncbi:response regulator [Aurantibacillus circumpalustris]|uniref:response regulator n=1 Tax=Aurantibacillus circumpalustris TaxID=3036359 RepID=UPI00295B8752|nr:response regulator [Aurantibacillus circumpalustris]
MEFTKPIKIFVVDDDVMLTEALSDYLTRKVAHQVSCFHTGEEALRRIGDNPDIVILDFYMNTVKKDAATGLEILEVIHKHYPSTMVIMLSSQESYVKAAQTISKGAIQYVIKDEDAFEKIMQQIESM